MSEVSKTAEAAAVSRPKVDLESKWETCVDLGARRLLYSSLAGAFGGLLLFRSPVTRWAAVALGAGVGLGSAYTECSYKFNESSAKNPTISKIVQVPSPESPQVSAEPSIPKIADVPSLESPQDAQE